MTGRRYQIRTVRTQEQWVEVGADDAVTAQQLAQQTTEWADVPATVRCYAIRLTESQFNDTGSTV